MYVLQASTGVRNILHLKSERYWCINNVLLVSLISKARHSMIPTNDLFVHKDCCRSVVYTQDVMGSGARCTNRFAGRLEKLVALEQRDAK